MYVCGCYEVVYEWVWVVCVYWQCFCVVGLVVDDLCIVFGEVEWYVVCYGCQCVYVELVLCVECEQDCDGVVLFWIGIDDYCVVGGVVVGCECVCFGQQCGVGQCG